MAERVVDVLVACDLCDKCYKFEIESMGVHIIDAFGRGWPTFKPHCKHIDICKNLLEMQQKKKEEKTDAAE